MARHGINGLVWSAQQIVVLPFYLGVPPRFPHIVRPDNVVAKNAKCTVPGKEEQSKC